MVGTCGIPQPANRVAAVPLELAIVEKGAPAVELEIGSAEKGAPAVAVEAASAEKDGPAVAAEPLSMVKVLPCETAVGFGRGAKDPPEMTAGLAPANRPCIGKVAG